MENWPKIRLVKAIFLISEYEMLLLKAKQLIWLVFRKYSVNRWPKAPNTSLIDQKNKNKND